MKRLSKEKNLKITLIAMKIAMAVSALLIIVNVVSFFASKAKSEKCTQAMWGVVTEVERIYIARHGTSYKAKVRADDYPGKVFESIKTHHEYRKGDRVAICYDPDDMSNYYIEYADPEVEDMTLVLCSSVLLIVMFVLHMYESKKYKKLLSEQDTVSE